MSVRNFRAAIVLLALGALPAAVFAQRGPAAQTPAQIRAGIARLETQRQQLKDQATRMDGERRDLEQQLDRLRRDEQVLQQQIANTESQLRQLQAALLQAQP